MVSGVDEDCVVAGSIRRPLPGMSPPRWPPPRPTRSRTRSTPRLPPIALSSAVIRCCTTTASCAESGVREEARLGWQQMAGKSGQLYTGHCVIRLRDNTITYRAADATVTTVNFGIPSPADLGAYVESGEPTSVAGGFTLDGLGGWFIESVDGDPSSVIGIGLPLTRRLLEGARLSIRNSGRPTRSPPKREQTQKATNSASAVAFCVCSARSARNLCARQVVVDAVGQTPGLSSNVVDDYRNDGPSEFLNTRESLIVAEHLCLTHVPNDALVLCGHPLLGHAKSTRHSSPCRPWISYCNSGRGRPKSIMTRRASLSIPDYARPSAYWTSYRT